MTRLLKALKALVGQNVEVLDSRELYCIRVEATANGYEKGYRKAQVDFTGQQPTDDENWEFVARIGNMTVQRPKSAVKH